MGKGRGFDQRTFAFPACSQDKTYDRFYSTLYTLIKGNKAVRFRKEAVKDFISIKRLATQWGIY